MSTCFETQTLQNKIPFDPQNITQQEKVNCKHATTVKPPTKQLPARNMTPHDPQMLMISTSEVSIHKAQREIMIK